MIGRIRDVYLEYHNPGKNRSLRLLFEIELALVWDTLLFRGKSLLSVGKGRHSEDLAGWSRAL